MIKVIGTVAQKELMMLDFLKQSAGQWKSQRRYYTLEKETEPEEVESLIKIRYLEQGSPELLELAQIHQLKGDSSLVGGAKVSWTSNYTGKIRKPSTGSTIFGVLGDIMYRNRGFATTKPVTATYYFSNPHTMALKTEYNGSVFEEEVKLIGNSYRTRQTIISRAGQEIMIGQYLEKRY
ncbi:MAG: phycobiliprotein lyase [Cyanobacteria bacterium J083]|nr:MAG: phycobiliprotein lyase [Cyanobacteria bacterium J083]